MQSLPLDFLRTCISRTPARQPRGEARHVAALGVSFGAFAPVMLMVVQSIGAPRQWITEIGPWIWPSAVILVFLGYGRWTPLWIAIGYRTSIAINIVSFSIVGIVIGFGRRAFFYEDEIAASLRKPK
jgi:hypothetical protein